MRLLITTPTGGTVTTDFYRSMMQLNGALRDAGIAFTVQTFDFSDIVTSRNYLLSLFLTQEKFTHNLMLDSDVHFAPKQVLRLIEADKPFTAALHPNRRPNWDQLRNVIERQADMPEDKKPSMRAVLAATQHYVATQSAGVDHDFTPKTDGEFETYATVGTGFVLINREVPETMVDKGVARPLPRNGQQTGFYPGAARFYDFFSHRLSADGFLYGEDQSLCLRWVVDCGGEIWADTKSRVSHIGPMRFDGKHGIIRNKRKDD